MLSRDGSAGWTEVTADDVAVVTTPADKKDDGPLDQSIAEEFDSCARADGVDLVGAGGSPGDLTTKIPETGLEVERDEHLGYTKHDAAGPHVGIPRNGTRSKTVITEVGPVELHVPPDRESSFEPNTESTR